MLGGRVRWACQTVDVVPVHDPIVVYAMVTALIVALAVGIFFATPLREVLTGPDELGEPPASDEPSADGPWSTATPTADPKWPSMPPNDP